MEAGAGGGVDGAEAGLMTYRCVGSGGKCVMPVCEVVLDSQDRLCASCRSHVWAAVDFGTERLKAAGLAGWARKAARRAVLLRLRRLRCDLAGLELRIERLMSLLELLDEQQALGLGADDE